MWEVMTGEAAQQSLLQASLCRPFSLIFPLSFSAYLLLCSCACDKPADRRQFLSATLINAAWHVPVRAVAVHTHTHTLRHPYTHTHTCRESALCWRGLFAGLSGRALLLIMPQDTGTAPTDESDRVWARCQSPLTLTCMLLGLFNSDCETVPSIGAVHPPVPSPGSASFDWIGIISKIYVTDSPGRTSSHVWPTSD